MRWLAACFGLGLLAASPAAAESLQAMIDAAADGAEIAPPAGVYDGPVRITRPVVINGSAGVVIDGNGKGTVVTLESDKATLKNLTIRNSGRLHNQVDAGLRIKGSNNVIRDVKVENSLFGIDLTQANDNILRRNHVTSKDMPLELRGDSIRLWYSNGNKLESNVIEDSRDFVVWYSKDNVIKDNRIRRGRYGIHFMYAHVNHVLDNEIADCVVGVFLMYSNDIELRRNRILRSWGASGMGVGFKETSGAVLTGNAIIGNATGIYVDTSPWDPEATNEFADNTIAYNGIGIEFLTDWKNNNFSRNALLSNFTQVSVKGGGTAKSEGWHGNFWDDFAGFDKDGDGKGDSPYEIYTYADRLWMDRPYASFFRGGLALAALDFVERLAPFTEPRLLMSEPAPLYDMPNSAPAADAGSLAEVTQ